MNRIVHNLWHIARTNGHKSLTDAACNLNYCLLMNTKEKSGARIKDARNKKGVSLQKISELLDGVVSRSRLSNYEQGTRMIDVDMAKIVAPVLGTTPEYILTLTDEAPDPGEVELLALFRSCDDRGRDATLGTARNQAALSRPKNTTQNAVDKVPDKPAKLTAERRKAKEARRKSELGFDPERRHLFGAPNFPHKNKTDSDRRRKKNE